MLTQYISAAMRRAKYEILEDGTYYSFAHQKPIPVVDGIGLAITEADV